MNNSDELALLEAATIGARPSADEYEADAEVTALPPRLPEGPLMNPPPWMYSAPSQYALDVDPEYSTEGRIGPAETERALPASNAVTKTPLNRDDVRMGRL